MTESLDRLEGVGKFQTYANYKDSGLPWLGEVPEYWNLVRLKRACLMITDGSHFSPPSTEMGCPYVTVRDLVDGKVNVEGAAKISESDFALLARNGCRPRIGDVLFSKDGTIGKVAEVTRDDFVVLSSLAILRPGSHLHASFLAYFLRSKLGTDQMESYLAGAALRRITLDVIVNLAILLPPIEEQHAIVTYLDQETTKIETAIATYERLNVLLQEKRQALISHAVTKGLDPNVLMRDSGVEWLREVPAHWEVTRLKESVAA